MRLEHAFTFTTALVGPHVVGEGPHGLRHHYEMIDGTIEGPRITAPMRGSGAAWRGKKERSSGSH